jgi:hypothetical protein
MNVDIKSDPTFYTPIAKIIVEAYPNISFMFFEKISNRHLGTIHRSKIEPSTPAHKAVLQESRWPL